MARSHTPNQTLTVVDCRQASLMNKLVTLLSNKGMAETIGSSEKNMAKGKTEFTISTKDAHFSLGTMFSAVYKGQSGRVHTLRTHMPLKTCIAFPERKLIEQP